MQKFTKNFNTVCYTDMACELYRQRENEGGTPFLHETHTVGRISYEKLTVPDEAAEKQLGKSVGTYYTVHTGTLGLATREATEDTVTALRTCLLGAIRTHLPDFCVPGADDGAVSGITPEDTVLDSPGEEAEERRSTSPEWERGQTLLVTGAEDTENAEVPIHDVHVEAMLSAMMELPPVPVRSGFGGETDAEGVYSVLCVGLGNPHLTPDALGPAVTSRLVITRHMAGDTDAGAIFDGVHRVSAFVPMARGQTGMETLSLVRGAVEAAKPDLVILIDALAASEMSSLARTVQIATTGIHPGGGVGNRGQALTRETLGVPVITVGVPTVIGTATMVVRVLERTGLLPTEAHAGDALFASLSEDDMGCVTPKDVDSGVRAAAGAIARAINGILTGDAVSAEFGALV